MERDVDRLIADVERLRGKLRIAVRRTEDGLGIQIPPRRRLWLVAFLSLWLCGWAVGMVFALRALFNGGPGFPDLFLLIWLIPWTTGGVFVLRTVAWQLFGVESLFFTADSLVREWRVPGFVRRRVVHGPDIVSVEVDGRSNNDSGWLGSINVTTTDKPLRIGSGLERHEAELVVLLIEDAARSGREEAAPSQSPAEGSA